MSGYHWHLTGTIMPFIIALTSWLSGFLFGSNRGYRRALKDVAVEQQKLRALRAAHYDPPLSDLLNYSVPKDEPTLRTRL